MDNHPIPQDVTGFQFKLIGTMTVKQFGYVASGVVLAVILYYTPIQSAFGILLKVLLIPLLGSSGVVIAFVPLEGRAIDVMAGNFVKALFSPNQYVYHRQGQILSFMTISSAKAPAATTKTSQKGQQPQKELHVKQHDEKAEKLEALLRGTHERTLSETDKREAAFLNALTRVDVPSPSPTNATIAPAPVAMPAVAVNPSGPAPIQTSGQIQPLPPLKEPTEADLEKIETQLEQELSKAKQEESTSKTTESHTAATQKVSLLSKQIQEIHDQKKQLEQELSHLQKELASEKNSASLTAAPAQPVQDPQHVRTIPQAVTKNAGLPHISDSPNVVVGIVKDPRGNILPNILVEVKDKDGNPVRAFKTNPLGQFASATPLSPGTYTIELEDPKKQHRFDVVQIVANNQILLPIEIISHDAREELRKQLFTN